jgi:hypothetical protein
MASSSASSVESAASAESAESADSADSVESEEEAASESSVDSEKEMPAPPTTKKLHRQAKGCAEHAPYLRRLNLAPTHAENEAMTTLALEQGTALCAGNEATADEIERKKVSPILAGICRRAALEALALSRTQPGEEAYFEACSDWLTNAAEFGFESSEERHEFKKLIAAA